MRVSLGLAVLCLWGGVDARVVGLTAPCDGALSGAPPRGGFRTDAVVLDVPLGVPRLIRIAA